MNRMSFVLCTVVLVCTWLTARAQGASAPLVLPHPQQMELSGGSMVLVSEGKPACSMAVEPGSAAGTFAAEWVNERVSALCGVELPVVPEAQGACIALHRPGSVRGRRLMRTLGIDFGAAPDASQAYAIASEGGVVHVVAEGEDGLVYAAYTLGQLLTGDAGRCELPSVRVVDYPAAPVRGLLWLRGSDAYRHSYSQWAASFKMNAYTWYVPWDQPLSPQFRDVLADCRLRGMTLIPTISWFQNTKLRYSKPEFVEPMLSRVREALGAGAGAFGFNFDDVPLRVFGEDEGVYDSLIAAQADLLNKVHEITGPADASLFFTPTIYWKPYAGAQGNSLEDQYAYVRGMGRLFPPQTKTFTTTLSREWADEYLEITGRKPVFWHNFFPNDMIGWKMYFEPYPRFAEELVTRSQGAFVLGGWQTDWWKVNYLTFASNTWNPRHPCTLQEAFARLYPQEADRLTRCAVLLGGHNEPSDTMGMGEGHPHRALDLQSFFNLEPTERNLASLEKRLADAEEAEAIAMDVATRDEVPAAMCKELVAAATRMKLNYRMALAATRVRQMEQAGERNRLASEETQRMVDECLQAGTELEQLIGSVGWPAQDASDVVLRSYFESLKERLASGQGATPRLTAVQCAQAPSIDGRLDEPAWATAPGATPFYLIEGKPRPAEQQTDVRVLFDDKALYLGVTCRESRMEALKAEMTRHDDMVWEDDCVEVFIDPQRGRKDYYHFIANAAGVRFDEKVVDGRKDAEWNGEWTVATQREEDRWTAEIAIPLTTLGVDRPSGTERFGFNVTREEVPSQEVSAWALTFGSFHQPGMFGDLVFGGEEGLVWVEAESVEKTNFLYGVQLASKRPEARGTNGTGYLNLNVAHEGGPSGDPPDGSPDWFARWQLDVAHEGDYALWVLGSDGLSGSASWQLDERAPQDEDRLASVEVAPAYARPLGLGKWHLIRLEGLSGLSAGPHSLTLRVRAEDPAAGKRCGYFIDTLVLAPEGWSP